MEMYSLFYGHDNSIMMNESANKPRTSPLWIESRAPILLKQDIDEGLHNHLTPGAPCIAKRIPRFPSLSIQKSYLSGATYKVKKGTPIRQKEDSISAQSVRV